MELLGSHRGDRTNTSADRSSPEHDPSKFALINLVQPATKKLSVSAILFGILGGIIGIAAGLFLGFALGATLAAAFHVSTFEGEAGYFAAAIALLVTCIVVPGPDSSYALLARHTRALALRRVDSGLFIAQ